MPYTGAIIAFDLASVAGVADGCVGEIPKFFDERLRKPGEDFHTAFGRAARLAARLTSAERIVEGKTYAIGEAASAGLIRVVIEEPLFRVAYGITQQRTQTLLQGLWAAVAGVTVGRGVPTVRVPPSTVRKHFLGRADYSAAEVKQHVERVCRERLGWHPQSYDCADAAALWHWASWRWNPDRTPVLYQAVLPGLGRAHV